MTNPSTPAEVIRILLVEDDEDDARLAKAAILESPEVQGLPVLIQHLPSMQNVLKTLAEANPPFHSVLIDLGMLGKYPLKTLEAIREFCPNVQTNTSKTDSPAAFQVKSQFPVLSKDVVFTEESVLSQRLLGDLGEERRAREDASRRYGKEFKELAITLAKLEASVDAFQKQIYAREISGLKDQIDDLKEVIRDLQEMVPTNAAAIAGLNARTQSIEDTLTNFRQELTTLRQDATAPAPPPTPKAPEPKDENLRDKLALLSAQYRWQLITALVGTLTTILIARYSPSREALDQLKQPPAFPPTPPATTAPTPASGSTK